MEISKDRLDPVKPTEVEGKVIDPSRLVPSGKGILPSSNQGTSFMHGVGVGTRGALKGIASLPLVFGNAANALVNLGLDGVNHLTGLNIKKITPASQAFENVLDYAGLPRAETGWERLGEEATAATSAAMTFAGGANIAKDVGAKSQLVYDLARHPMVQSLSGTASGLSSGVAREAGAGPVGQTAAGVVGAMAPGSAHSLRRIAPSSKKGAAKVWEKGSIQKGLKTTRAGAQRAREQKEGVLSEVITENQLKSNALEEQIPGLNLNAAARSGDPNLLALMRTRHGLNAQQMARVNELENTQSLMRYIRKNIVGEGDAGDFLKKVNQAKKEVAVAKAEALDFVSRAEADITPSSSLDEIGQKIRGAVLDEKSKASAKMTKMWNQIDSSAELDRAPLMDTIRDVFGSYDEYFSRVSSIPGRAMTKAQAGVKPKEIPFFDAQGRPINLAQAPKNMTVGQLAEFNKQITRDARMARAAGDDELAMNLYRLKDGIDDTVEAAAGSGGVQGGKLKAFWETYKRQFVPRFKQGKTFEILRKKGTGEYRVSDTDVGKQYFQPGKKGIEGYKSFKATFGDNPQAKKFVRDYAADDLLRNLRKSPKGLMDEKRFDAWKRANSEALKAYGMGDEFNTLQSSLQKVGMAIEREKLFNKSILSKVLGVDADVAVRKIMSGVNSGKNMDDIIEVVGKDKKALAGLKAAVGNWFEDSIKNFRQTLEDGTNVFSGNKVEQFINKNMSTLSKVYSPKEMSAYRNVLTALKKMSLENYAAKNVGSSTKELFSSPMEFIGSYMPLDPKVRILRRVVQKLAQPYKEAVDEIITEAFYNPQKAERLQSFARELRQASTEASVKNTVRRFVERQALLQSGMNAYRE